MPLDDLIRVGIAAESLDALRRFIAEINPDLGCRPSTRRTQTGFVMNVYFRVPELFAIAARSFDQVALHSIENVTAIGRDRLADVGRGNRFAVAEAMPLGLGLTSIDQVPYLNIDEIESAIESLATAYPDIARSIALPHPTHEGRVAHALKIGKRSISEVDCILVLGGVHGSEWVPPDALISLAADLIGSYSAGPELRYGGLSFTSNQVQDLLDTTNLLFFPCVNPDGRHHSLSKSDTLWRKNRRPVTEGRACIGVDINRNFDFLWDYKVKFSDRAYVNTSRDPCDGSPYHGPHAASEPETRNVIWLLDSFPRIRFHVDVHSAGNEILYSWGSDSDQGIDPSQNFMNAAFDGKRGIDEDSEYREYISDADLETIKRLATCMAVAIRGVNGNNYEVKQAFDLYPTSGTSDDYAFSRCFADPSKSKVYAFVVECGTSFDPEPTVAARVIREVSAGLIAFALCSRSVV